jgi:ubiquinone biosynthesis protein
MVARISEKLKARLIRILIAVSEGEGEKAAESTLSIGEKLETINEKQFIREVTELVNQTQDNKLEQIEVGRLMLEITRISAMNGLRLPDEIIMLGKTLMNLDKAGRKLDPKFDPNESLRRNAPKLIRQIFTDSFRRGNIYEKLLDIKNILENLPARVNDILNILAKNQFTIHAKIIDEKDFISGLKESANRMTIGLVLAALIVGAAILMQVDTAFKLFGYPGLAILFFLFAAIGGIILVFRVLFKDR